MTIPEMNTNKSHLLSQYARERIDHWILRYPPEHKRSGVFEALRVVQEENNNSLTPDLMEAVADYLGMSHVAVYEVATFYSMYFLQPMGRHIVDVCTNISCELNGASEVVRHLKQKLGVDFNETTADGNFTLREVECLGACVGAPACQIGKKYYENVTPNSIDKVLEELSNGK